MSPSRTLEGLFEQTQRPSKALDSPRALLPDTEIQGHSQLYGTRRGGANLDCAFLKDALVFVVPNIVVAWAPLGPPLKPPKSNLQTVFTSGSFCLRILTTLVTSDDPPLLEESLCSAVFPLLPPPTSSEPDCP